MQLNLTNPVQARGLIAFDCRSRVRSREPRGARPPADADMRAGVAARGLNDHAGCRGRITSVPTLVCLHTHLGTDTKQIQTCVMLQYAQTRGASPNQGAYRRIRSHIADWRRPAWPHNETQHSARHQ